MDQKGNTIIIGLIVVVVLVIGLVFAKMYYQGTIGTNPTVPSSTQPLVTNSNSASSSGYQNPFGQATNYQNPFSTPMPQNPFSNLQ